MVVAGATMGVKLEIVRMLIPARCRASVRGWMEKLLTGFGPTINKASRIMPKELAFIANVMELLLIVIVAGAVVG